jgi:peptide/nickel transport system substrate-binding protein
MLIENSPNSLDPRVGTDAQAEHIDSLIFDGLVERDEHFELHPGLALSWETPDPLTYIFHLRHGVRFHNGKLLDAGDVKWTIDSMLNGIVVSPKTGSLAKIAHIDTPDAYTVVLHLKQPDAALLWNLSGSALGIVPAGSGKEFAQDPIGTGPFRFVSQRVDSDVILERNTDSWQPLPSIRRIRFSVVPDAITRALELEKGSADVCINCLTADMIAALQKVPRLQVESVPGTSVNYITFNTVDPILKDFRVRRAIAMAINRPLIIQALGRHSLSSGNENVYR